MARLEKREIRMTADIWKSLHDVAYRVYDDRVDERGGRSGLVREWVGHTANAWLRSPYYCTSSKHFVYVNRFGDLFYRAEEILHLNAYRGRLPCSLEQKVEKQEYYLRNRPTSADGVEWLRQRWMFNHFAVWEGLRGVLLDKYTDGQGILRKMADLAVDRPEGTALTREMMIGLTDYVQWKEDGRRQVDVRDRSGVEISIPTKNFFFVAMIDRALFDGLLKPGYDLPPLRMELRNKDGARYSDAGLLDLRMISEDPVELETGSFMMDEHRHGKGSEHFDGTDCLESFGSFVRRANEIGSDAFSKKDDAVTALLRLKQPSDFLYCRVRWPIPPIGVEICITWEKVPKRISR